MSPSRGRASLHLFRIASLIAPSALAWQIAFAAPHPSELTEAVARTLGPIWLVTMVALALRTLGALVERGASSRPLLDRIDVLTASGSALAWSSAAAIALSVWVGFASLALVGLMGTAVLHLAVLWSCLRVAGADPFRRATISRRFVPARLVEGDPVTEELRLTGVRIPIGFRLFASGRVGPRWPLSRYAVDDAASGGEIVLEREVGPARRGEHRPPPLELWFEDVFGLCRTARFRAGAARLTVLPRPRSVSEARPTRSAAGAELDPKPAARLPTEGSLRLREYQPGDDARRIHWVRSLVACELVVRLPDEIPPDRPAVDVVLDTYLPGVEALRCEATGELLDALVAVWLGVARALARGGARVTLVTAAPREQDPHAGDRSTDPRSRSADDRSVERLLLHRANEASALRLGARAAWQGAIPVSEIARGGATMIVSCRVQPDVDHEAEGSRSVDENDDGSAARWILVPEPVWTCFDDLPPAPAHLVFPHPMGSADNRRSRRRLARRRFNRALREHGTFAGLCVNLARPRPGSLVARPDGADALRLEELQ